MIIAYIISLCIFLIYISSSLIVFKKIPSSISMTYYLWKEKKECLGYLFPFFCWGVSFPLLYTMIELSPDNLQFLAFFAPVGLIFVGGAMAFKDDLTDRVHYGSAIFCMVSALLWMILLGYWIVPFICLAVCSLIALMDKKWVFWMEMGTFIAMFMVIDMVIKY